MNPEESNEPNCEGIFLEMQDDAVVKIVCKRLTSVAKMYPNLKVNQIQACFKSSFTDMLSSVVARLNSTICRDIQLHSVSNEHLYIAPMHPESI